MTAGSVQPFLRWAGSKRAQYPLVERLFADSGRRYVEPFAGSASLFFLLQPLSALLGDLNSELVETFIELRRDPEAVSSELGGFPVGREAYYRIRGLKPGSLLPAQRAARFIYLNRFCFNGLFRTNSLGAFNVPYGAPKNSNRPCLDHLKRCASLLTRAEIAAQDFRRTLYSVQPNDFVYLDPPYAVSNRRMFVEYLGTPFCASDLDELAAELTRIHTLGARFVLSYADSAEARSRFSKWESIRRRVRRNVAGFNGARRFQYELIFSNLDLNRRIKGHE